MRELLEIGVNFLAYNSNWGIGNGQNTVPCRDDMSHLREQSHLGVAVISHVSVHDSWLSLCAERICISSVVLDSSEEENDLSL